MSLATDLFDEPPTCAERGCKTILPEGAYRFCADCQQKRIKYNQSKRGVLSETRTCKRLGCEKPAKKGGNFCCQSCQREEDRRTGNQLPMWGGMMRAGEKRKALIREMGQKVDRASSP